MRAFTEAGNKPKAIIVELSLDEAQTISIAMFDYCQNNKRMIKAKKLLKEMDAKFEVY